MTIPPTVPDMHANAALLSKEQLDVLASFFEASIPRPRTAADHQQFVARLDRIQKAVKDLDDETFELFVALVEKLPSRAET
jgi:hypothetical protein